MPKFSKGHYSGKIKWFFFFKFNQVIYLSSPISWSSFKPLAQIVFEIPCWQDFILMFSKGHNSRKGDNLDKKKNSYFSIRNPYMKFQNPSMHVFWQTDARMHRQPKTNMLPQLLQSWGHNETSRETVVETDHHVTVKRIRVSVMLCGISLPLCVTVTVSW